MWHCYLLDYKEIVVEDDHSNKIWIKLNIFQSHRSVWENMQTVAEEKRKAYRCVCWSANPITKDILKVRFYMCVNLYICTGTCLCTCMCLYNDVSTCAFVCVCLHLYYWQFSRAIRSCESIHRCEWALCDYSSWPFPFILFKYYFFVILILICHSKHYHRTSNIDLNFQNNVL